MRKLERTPSIILSKQNYNLKNEDSIIKGITNEFSELKIVSNRQYDDIYSFHYFDKKQLYQKSIESVPTKIHFSLERTSEIKKKNKLLEYVILNKVKKDMLLKRETLKLEKEVDMKLNKKKSMFIVL